jgi:hypothetical protein
LCKNRLYERSKKAGNIKASRNKDEEDLSRDRGLCQQPIEESQSVYYRDFDVQKDKYFFSTQQLPQYCYSQIINGRFRKALEAPPSQKNIFRL